MTPRIVKTIVLKKPINNVCEAVFSALFLSFWPIYWAIVAVAPVPIPTPRPIIIKNKGLTNATAVTSSAPSHPINIISTTLNNVCTIIPAMIGKAIFHIDL